MESFINTVNGIVWSPALVYLCLGAGLFLSLRGGFLQLRHLKHMWQLLFQPKDNVTGVSSFQALRLEFDYRCRKTDIEIIHSF